MPKHYKMKKGKKKVGKMIKKKMKKGKRKK